jgi:hypothetical protein
MENGRVRAVKVVVNVQITDEDDQVLCEKCATVL